MTEANLENQLRAALQTLQPSHAFVQTVEKRFRPARPGVEVRYPVRWARFVSITSSILAGFLLTLTMARIFYYLSRRLR